MNHEIRAIYHNGQLQLLDPVSLVEGQQVNLTLHIAQDALTAALGDLLVPPDADEDPDFDEEAAMQQIQLAFAGQPPLSETIMQEREDGW
jgi:predicted DNA-binding antitoxin AbrB/MazE fold protein